MVYITEIHLSGGTGHEHISKVRWLDPNTQKSGTNSREEMVDWILNKNGEAWVKGKPKDARVGVVNAHPPYLRTFADNQYTNNLLDLPRF